MSASAMLLPANPQASYLAHKADIDQAVRRVLEGGWYILGEEVHAFESEFARYVGVRHAVGVGSGTEALHLALRACGIGPGDLVLTVSHTAVATVAAIELAGAAPVLVDIDPTTFTIDSNCLEDAVRAHGSRCKAIIPVHLYGHPANMPAIMEIAGRYGLQVIEDCAQSHGALLQGRKAGSWGHLAAFSFYPTKNLGALGDGGALVTDDPRLAEKANLLRQYGWRERYISDLPGMNTRLDELQAAVLRVKLPQLDEENARRREIARLYNTSLSGTTLSLPQSAGDVEHVYHQYVVRSQHRDALQAFLKVDSIGTLILYPQPVHLQPAYRDRVIMSGGGLPHTEQVCREILSLPMHPQLTDEEVQRINDSIVRWYGQAANGS